MIPRQAVIEGTLLAFFLALNEPAAAQSGGFVYAVYVVNCGERCRFGGAGPGDISAYLMDETTGALREVDGSPILAGFNPAAIAANPSGTNVYVVNEFSEDTGDLPGTLSTYSTISSGRLKEQGPPITVGERPVSVAVDPSGQYVYVANSYGGISGFVLDTTGYPQPMLRSPFPAGGTPRSVAVHPNGRFLYVANSGDATVSGYSIDADTGELTALSGSPFFVGADPESFTVSPSGLHGYAMHSNSDVISGWPINPTTGALNPTGSGYGATGRAPSSVTVMLDPVTGQQLIYVTNYLFNNITAFRGALTPVVGSPFPVFPANLPDSSAVDPTGRFLYVAGRSSSISAFIINGTTGELTQIAGSPFQAGAIPRAVTAVAVPIPGGNGP